MTRSVLIGVFLAMLAASPAVRAADAWPSRPVRLIVPFAAGSTPDLLARVLSTALQPRLKQPVLVDDKPGVGGILGVDLVAKAAPDGYTIGLAIAGLLTTNTLLYKKLPYDPVRDLVQISIVSTQPTILVANSQLGVNSMGELLAVLKRSPGKFNYGSIGVGSSSHLTMEAVAARSQTEIVHVPYPGSPQAVTALLSGDVQLACLPLAALMAHIKSGKLIVLAVATSQRSRFLPEVPTVQEAGLQGFQADTWSSLIAPFGTPASVVERLEHEVQALLKTSEVKENLYRQYMEPIGSTGREASEAMRQDVERWKPIIEKNNFRLD